MEAVLGAAEACGTGQPVTIAGDFNAEPGVIFVTAKALACRLFVDLEGACAEGRGVPVRLAQSGTVSLPASSALAANNACEVLIDRWFRPHFAFLVDFPYWAWSVEVQFARAVSPLSPECWLGTPEKSWTSIPELRSRFGRGIWRSMP